MFHLENLHAAQGIAPAADSLASTVRTDVVNCKHAGKVLFIIQKGVGTTGTSTITIEASDDVTPSNVTAIPFRYRYTTATDVGGAIVQASASGFVTEAGSNDIVVIEVNVDDVAAAGYQYVSLKAVEVADAAVLAGILILLTDLRYDEVAGATYLA